MNEPHPLKIGLLLIIAVALTLGLSVSFQSLLAQWAPPSDAPPDGDMYKPIYATSTSDQKIDFINSNDSLSVGGDFVVGGMSDYTGTSTFWDDLCLGSETDCISAWSEIEGSGGGSSGLIFGGVDTSPTFDTDYVATSSGIVNAYTYSCGTDDDVQIYGYRNSILLAIDSARTHVTSDVNKAGALSFPVNSGDTWRVTRNGSGCPISVRWTPVMGGGTATLLDCDGGEYLRHNGTDWECTGAGPSGGGWVATGTADTYPFNMDCDYKFELSNGSTYLANVVFPDNIQIMSNGFDGNTTMTYYRIHVSNKSTANMQQDNWSNNWVYANLGVTGLWERCGGGGTPSGAVTAFNLNACPAGWSPADGSGVSGDNPNLDLRGQFVRGLDDGSAGVDPDAPRAVGSSQSFAIENIVGSFSSYRGIARSSSGAFTRSSGEATYSGPGPSGGDNRDVNFNASNVVQTSTETRPTNVALIYCVKD